MPPRKNKEKRMFGIDRMKPAELEQYFKNLQKIESAADRHIAMDFAMTEVLSGLGYGDAVKIFRDTDKFYGGD